MIFPHVAALNSSGFSPKVGIIGSGPAGISLALQLERHGIPSVIFEAGGYDYDPTVQDAYKGHVIGDPYFDLAGARLRYFGGSSGHWAGWCRPLDEIDFEPRKGFRNSGWPTRKKDLDPYIKATDAILELEPLKPDEPVNQNLREIFFQFSPPVRFGQKYRKHISDSSTIGLLTYSPVTEVVPANGCVDHLLVHTREGSSQKVTLPYYCLCAGGIENSRLLLWSNLKHNAGAVPYPETLGKYWMEHPIFGAGDAVIFNRFSMSTDSHWGMKYFAPTSTYLHTHNMGNFGLRLLSGGPIKALIKDGLCVAPELFGKLLEKAGRNLHCATTLRIAWEQLPVSSNRIELDTEKDKTGMPRTKLFWKKQPEDRHTVETAIQTFGTYLATTDQGRMKVVEWIVEGRDYPADEELAGFHHMGGTRMAATPAHGIVDRNCKVFGVDNLYIGGSSVFPTGGHTNPTYSIVQLALRLGDHLAQRIVRA